VPERRRRPGLAAAAARRGRGTEAVIDNTLRLLARVERTDDVLAGWARA
jgi:hypothetical protein